MKNAGHEDPDDRPLGQGTGVERRYKIALALMATLILATFILMQNALHIQEVKIRLNALTSSQSRLFVDIGAMMRGLMQGAASGEMPEASLDGLRGRIKLNTARVRYNMDEILTLDDEFFLGLFEGGTVSRFYRQPPFSLESKLRTFLQRAEEIALLDTEKLRARQRQYSPIDIVVASASLMQSDFDHIMLNSFDVTQRNIARIKTVELCISMSALALLIVEWIVIFAPLVRRLDREQAQTIRQRNELRELSRRDGLTGLGNRLGFQDQLFIAVADARNAGCSACLVLMDLDRFKPINDALGHQAGDAILRAVADRARTAMETEAFVARIGGDEFGLVLRSNQNTESLDEIIRRLKRAVEQTVIYESHQLEIAASFGAAILPPDFANDADWLFGAADAALYRAKQDRIGLVIYDETLRFETETQREVALGLKRALTANELEVFYQPQVRLADQRLVGFEALIRWRHPERGQLSPAVFLPAAERHGLMTDITIYVIERVAADLGRWVGGGFEPGVIAVNMPEAMLATNLAQHTIDRAMTRQGLTNDRIGIEVTEDVLLNRNSKAIVDTLRNLQAEGMRVSFDDFGTGYASLSHLRSFPLDEIKIDRSFIRDMFVDDSSAEIVGSLIRLAANLKKTVVAEGIETLDQLDFLVREGCPVGQGYLFSPPVPFEEATAMIQCSRFGLTAAASLAGVYAGPVVERIAV